MPGLDFFNKTPKWNILQLFFVSLSFCSFTMNHVFSKYAHYSRLSATAYLIYYAILVICLPLIYVQLNLGGKLQMGIVGIFGVSIPILKGTGIAVLITAFIRSLTDTYHMGILAFYAFQSLKSPFPWDQAVSTNLYDAEKTYLWNDVRVASEGIDDVGIFYWWLPTCNAAVWGIIFLGICGGLKWVGIVLTVLGSVAITLSATLLAYGREEFEHSSAPEKNFYKVNWEESLAPNSLVAFTDRWIPVINMTVIIAAVFLGSFPTIGKCISQTSIMARTSWMPVVLVLGAMPHLFINMLAPYLDAAALALGVTNNELITNAGSTTDSLFLLLPRIMSALKVTRGVAFIWFLTLFVYALMYQILHGAVIVDNFVDWLNKTSFNCFSRKSYLHLTLSMLYCAVAIVLSLPMVTQATFIYFAQFDEEVQNISLLGRDQSPIVYPTWAYALGWLICLGPIVLGLLLGLMHSCCSSEKRMCARAAYDDAISSNGEDIIDRKAHKGHFHEYRSSGHNNYLEPSGIRRY
ncbi:hypothetical protein CAPTEDRAFT_224334 [Capitella teleta]|uniref:Uncharacterized protein n=1 Tax=Capitella teleta TaxID=283909 RepID=R7V3U5_CAPTE|nr:hypothetical protein CAPTEDRAFT_224334 [Capitella teleta]|eukprot:ELU13137.1 hypothetical protein CAPTEDRAFT_224334 [Capitella teleta]